MTYKGYVGIVRVDEDSGVLRGKVVDTKDTITFQGKSIDEVTTAPAGKKGNSAPRTKGPALKSGPK